MADNKEKFCSDCKHDYKLASEYPCNECCNAYTSKFESKTNFDKIKEMSVDEMTEFLCAIWQGKNSFNRVYANFFGRKIPDDFDDKAIRKLLEREVQNNG